MNKKACTSIVLAALLLGSGVGFAGWCVGQQIVNAIRETEAAQLRFMKEAAKVQGNKLDLKG